MIIHKNIKCTSCGLCEVVCKRNSIKIKLSKEGYYRPFINNYDCNNCGLCEKVCPAFNKFKFSSNNISAYAVCSKDEETIRTCASGGIGDEIGKLMLKKGYEVCGVVYDLNQDIAKHKICNGLNDLDKTKGSKYIQSYSVDAFEKVLTNLKNKRYVVFGTPCQIAAIHKYAMLTKTRDKLVLVDFFCHGTPSYLLWSAYLDKIKKQKNIKFFEEVRFRDKKLGWHNYVISLKYNNTTIYSDRIKDRDLFYEFFLGNYCLNESCYTCNFRADKSKSDIRIGDLWGRKYANDKKGVSGVIVFTNMGRKIIKELYNTCNINHEEVDTVLEGQMRKDINVPNEREYILSDFAKRKSLAYIYYRRIIPFKVKRKMKRILSK